VAHGHSGGTVSVNLTLAIPSVQENVQVDGETGTEDGDGAGTSVLNANQVQQLPMLSQPKKPDFALALQRREIDVLHIVNATTPDYSYRPTPLHQTVSAPQRLWIGSVRLDSQTSKN
jgi:hypothetical protein